MNLSMEIQVSKSYSHNGFHLHNMDFSMGSGKISGVVGEDGNRYYFTKNITLDLSYNIRT
jgi:translation initiation factor RLI1